MLGDTVPFRLAGNLYFVGEKRASCHMIDTGEGLILIDVGYEETADIVIESMETLGFDVKDVKYILLSHGHYDHSNGVPKIVERSGAKVFLFREDVRYLAGYEPDVYFKDGDVIRLGNTEILVLHTPGHTAGTASFFFNVEEKGQTYRVGTFGGAGIRQMGKAWLDSYGLPYVQRRQFFESVQRLRGEKVDIFVGNHTWQNKTREKYELSLTQEENPFIDPTEWERFLNRCEKGLWKQINEESVTEFVNYAHRGASEYYPENTLISFCHGLLMGANGIETDLRRTKDGVIVLFHDKTLKRVCGEEGSVSDYTWEELQKFTVKKDGFADRILRFEDFLFLFARRHVTFAIELKDPGLEEEVAALLRKYGMATKTVVTSFEFDYIKAFKEYAGEFRVGHLIPAEKVDEEELRRLAEIGADEICPSAEGLTEEMVRRWHGLGFRVRAYGMKPEWIESVCALGVDGMTVNYPDRLTEFQSRRKAEFLEKKEKKAKA